MYTLHAKMVVGFASRISWNFSPNARVFQCNLMRNFFLFNHESAFSSIPWNWCAKSECETHKSWLHPLPGIIRWLNSAIVKLHWFEVNQSCIFGDSALQAISGSVRVCVCAWCQRNKSSESLNFQRHPKTAKNQLRNMLNQCETWLNFCQTT